MPRSPLRLISLTLVGIMFALLLHQEVPNWVQGQPSASPIQSLAAPSSNQLWPVQLGQRLAILRSRIPTVDRVVLVPDQATFLQALSQWSLAGRWPILIEGGVDTDRFLTRFQPAEVVRLPSVQAGKERKPPEVKQIWQIIAAAWNAQDRKSLEAQWQTLGWQPPGVVLTRLNDPALLAGITLAAYYGQPLAFLPEGFGVANQRLETDDWLRLRQAVTDQVQQTGYAYAALGDEIETLTLALEMAARYPNPSKPDEDLAVTDGLGRDAEGNRWAIAGWIFGSTERTIYQAMCALFLDLRSVLLYDSYPATDSWQRYNLANVAQTFEQAGIITRLEQRPAATRADWQAIAREPWSYDLVLLNSRGKADRFSVGQASAQVTDLPMLKIPAAIHMIHSWSATRPADPNTVGGRWLAQGAYLYIGSVHEPLLQAFNPPDLLVQRMRLGIPLIVAARQFNSPPWKITTIGDPLMVLTSPRPRLPPG